MISIYTCGYAAMPANLANFPFPISSCFELQKILSLQEKANKPRLKSLMKCLGVGMKHLPIHGFAPIFTTVSVRGAFSLTHRLITASFSLKYRHKYGKSCTKHRHNVPLDTICRPAYKQGIGHPSFRRTPDVSQSFKESANLGTGRITFVLGFHFLIEMSRRRSHIGT